MAEMDFEKLLSGEGIGGTLPDGPYTVKVIDARSHEGKGNGTVFLDLEVQSGPAKGEITQVSLFIPDGTSKNPRAAATFFARKIAGFVLGAEVGRAMNGGSPAPILAEALVDQVVEAELSVQKDGQYKGSQNLDSTKPVDAPAPKAERVPEAADAATETEDADEALPF